MPQQVDLIRVEGAPVRECRASAVAEAVPAAFWWQWPWMWVVGGAVAGPEDAAG